MIGIIIAGFGGFGFGLLLVMHDPPSGYNMGTGDSFVPMIIAFIIMLVGIVLTYLGV
jgi:hypothetical protein